MMTRSIFCVLLILTYISYGMAQDGTTQPVFPTQAQLQSNPAFINFTKNHTECMMALQNWLPGASKDIIGKNSTLLNPDATPLNQDECVVALRNIILLQMNQSTSTDGANQNTDVSNQRINSTGTQQQQFPTQNPDGTNSQYPIQSPPDQFPQQGQNSSYGPNSSQGNNQSKSYNSSQGYNQSRGYNSSQGFNQSKDGYNSSQGYDHSKGGFNQSQNASQGRNQSGYSDDYNRNQSRGSIFSMGSNSSGRDQGRNDSQFQNPLGDYRDQSFNQSVVSYSIIYNNSDIQVLLNNHSECNVSISRWAKNQTQSSINDILNYTSIAQFNISLSDIQCIQLAAKYIFTSQSSQIQGVLAAKLITIITQMQNVTDFTSTGPCKLWSQLQHVKILQQLSQLGMTQDQMKQLAQFEKSIAINLNDICQRGQGIIGNNSINLNPFARQNYAKNYNITMNSTVDGSMFTIIDLNTSLVVSGAQNIRWSLIQVTKIPGGKALPSFITSFAANLSQAEFCFNSASGQSSRRILRDQDQTQNTQSQLNQSSNTQVQFNQSSNTSVQLNDSSNTQWNQQSNHQQQSNQSQNTAQQSNYQGSRQSSFQSQGSSDDESNQQDEQSQQSDQQISRNNDIDQNDLMSQFRDLVGKNSVQKPNLKTSTLSSHFNYVWQVQFLTANNKPVTLKYQVQPTNLVNQVVEITNFTSYVNFLQGQINTNCLTANDTATTLVIDMNTQALQFLKGNMSQIDVTLAPFFQFETSDQCTESMGWRLNPVADNTLLTQNITVTLPFTTAIYLPGYLKLTITHRNGTQYVGYKSFTIQGQQLDAKAVTAQLSAPQQSGPQAGNPIDSMKAQMNKLNQLQQVRHNGPSQSDQQTAAQNGDIQKLPIVQNVLEKCNVQNSWTLQTASKRFQNNTQVQQSQSRQSQQQSQSSASSQSTNQTNTTGFNYWRSIYCPNNCSYLADQTLSQGQCNQVNNNNGKLIYNCKCINGFSGKSCQMSQGDSDILQKQVSGQISQLSNMSHVKVSDVAALVQQMASGNTTGNDTKNMMALLKNNAKKVSAPAEGQALLQSLDTLKQNLLNNQNLTDTDKQSLLLNYRQSNQATIQMMVNLTSNSSEDGQQSLNTDGMVGVIQNLNSSQAITITTSSSLPNPSSQNGSVLPSPQVTLPAALDGVKKAFVAITNCNNYIGLSCNSSQIVDVQLFDSTGAAMSMKPDDTRKFNISIPLNGENKTAQRCAYLAHDTNVTGNVSNSTLGFSLQNTGCVTLGVSQGKLHCQCNHLTEFISQDGIDDAYIALQANTSSSVAVNGNSSPQNGSNPQQTKTSNNGYLLTAFTLTMMMIV